MLPKLKKQYCFLYLLKEETQSLNCIYFFISAFCFTYHSETVQRNQGHCLLMCKVCLSHSSFANSTHKSSWHWFQRVIFRLSQILRITKGPSNATQIAPCSSQTSTCLMHLWLARLSKVCLLLRAAHDDVLSLFCSRQFHLFCAIHCLWFTARIAQLLKNRDFLCSQPCSCYVRPSPHI